MDLESFVRKSVNMIDTNIVYRKHIIVQLPLEKESIC